MKYFLGCRRRLGLIILCNSCLFSNIVFPQVTKQWVRLYDDPPNSWNNAIAIVADDFGNAYVTGESSGANGEYDIVTIKYNSSGAEEWIAYYDGFNGRDYPTAITLDKTGNLYIIGSSEGNGTGLDIVTIKYNNAGVQQWAARFNGPNSGSENTFGRHIINVDNNGNVYVLGMETTKNNTLDYVTIKYNNQGVQQWIRNYNGPGDGLDVPFAMALDPVTSDVYVTGFTSLGSDRNYATVKYNSAGDEQWVRTYNESYLDEAVGVALDTQGNVYVTGHSVSSTNVFGCVTIKYDPSGNTQWVTRYEDPDRIYFQANDLGVDSWGNVYITGYNPLYIQGTNPKQYKSECVTLKYNSQGIQQWVQLFFGNAVDFYEEGHALCLDDEGNVYVVGSSYNLTTNSTTNCMVLKYSPEGAQKWVEFYDGTTRSAEDITVNKLNDVFMMNIVTKNKGTAQSNNDYLTIKYVQPKPLTVTVTPDTTVYYGYGSNCVQLKAEVSGGVAPYTFTWLPGGSNPNNVSTTVCPTATAVYKMIVTDAIGTTNTAQVTVKVIDVRCGDKVIVCHNGKELCIASQAVAAHLQHGDKLGSCSLTTNDCDKLKNITSWNGKLPFIFKAYPNPFSHVSTIIYQLPIDAQVSITIVDVYGREIKMLVREKKRAGYYFAFVDDKKLVPGTYLCKMVISAPPCQSVHTLKLIVVK